MSCGKVGFYAVQALGGLMNLLGLNKQGYPGTGKATYQGRFWLMDRRRFLTLLVTVLALTGVGATSIAFIRSLGLTARTGHDSLALVDIPRLEPGEVYRLSILGQQLIALKPSDAQRASITSMDAHVWQPGIEAYNDALGAYVYWGYSTKWNCPLEHKPPQVSVLFEWHNSAKWLGGYWDVGCEVSYDYAGRAIKTYDYSYNGYTGKYPNLQTPTLFKKTGDKYLVLVYRR